jgi:Cu/Ag efflux protein CusF
MKKALALAVVMVFCAAIGFAGTGEHKGGMEGTITKVDMAGKSMVVKTADGKDVTVYWNDTTKLQGTPKEGETVHFKADEKDGKTTASWVHVGAMQPKTK